MSGGQTSPSGLLNSYMKSPEYKAAILNPEFTHVGVGCVISDTMHMVYPDFAWDGDD